MSIPRVAIVTGAGSGIGRAVCELLAESKFHLTLVGRNESRLLETVELLAAEIADPPETVVVPADISDFQQAKSVVDLTLERWGRVDVLINNAAVVLVRPIDQMDEQSLYEVFAANVFGPAYLISHCWDVFAKQSGGRVVNISSLSTVDPFSGLSIYAASKAALESLTRSINKEGMRHGVVAHSVILGAVETAMLRKVVSTDDLPTERALDALEAAAVIASCAKGERDGEPGEITLSPRP